MCAVSWPRGCVTNNHDLSKETSKKSAPGLRYLTGLWGANDSTISSMHSLLVSPPVKTARVTTKVPPRRVEVGEDAGHGGVDGQGRLAR